MSHGEVVRLKLAGCQCTIGQFDLVVRIDETIPGRDIAMDDILRFEILKGIGQLSNDQESNVDTREAIAKVVLLSRATRRRSRTRVKLDHVEGIVLSRDTCEGHPDYCVRPEHSSA